MDYKNIHGISGNQENLQQEINILKYQVQTLPHSHPTGGLIHCGMTVNAYERSNGETGKHGNK